MKSDFRQIAARVWAWTKAAARSFWAILSRRLGMKLLSLLLAILLWNYVVTTNRTITRSKTITDISGYVTSQSTLSTYKLALRDDPTALLNDVSVQLEVAQSDYGMVSAENVQVTLDLSKVRTVGVQEVPLKASTSYGKVEAIYPESVTLAFEPLDSRVIPVNVQLAGEKSGDYWYNVNRTNPSSISVSGAASIVQSISQARVATDVTGATESYVRAEPYVLLNAAGEEIPQTMLTISASSITVSNSIYPSKELTVSDDVAEVITGHPAEGYAVTNVTIQPETISVAGDSELLENLTQLHIEPISVDGLSQSFSVRARLSALPDLRYVSSEQVYVNVSIEEKDVSQWVENAQLSFVGKAENLRLDWQNKPLRVYVTGPRSVVEAVVKEGLSVTVDLSGLEAGSHSCPLRFPTDRYPELAFEPETPTVSVTLTETPQE